MIEMPSESDSDRSQRDKITIMLADDHPLLRQALADILNKQADFEII
jgi:hypothetical protein